MKITLTVWERIKIVNIIADERNNNPVRYRKLIKLLDILELSEEEQEAIKYREITPGRFTWDGETEYELEFEKSQGTLLTKLVNSYIKWDTNRLNGPLMEKFDE